MTAASISDSVTASLLFTNERASRACEATVPAGGCATKTSMLETIYHRVLFQNSIERSCRFSVIMTEESAEPRPSDDPA